ncbi:MAG: undecaprenyl-diphosphate phosphatase [Eubacterium sp.]|nr:undecaprenyl-diphosphate phosphatase [Eubacterium sp.]
MSFLEIIKVIFLGIVEGITEWLPISSTGHMLLVNEFLKLNVSEQFMNMFLVVIQLGAIMAVVVIYWKRLWPFYKEEGTSSGVVVKRSTLLMWVKVIIGTLPVMVIGLLFDDLIDKYLHRSVVIAIMLILYGVWFIFIENRNKGRRPRVDKMKKMTYKDALMVGLFQVLSIIPGTSRSGATIIGGLWIGLSRKVAAEYTFFLGIPAMFGASLLKILKFGLHFKAYEFFALILGMGISFIVSIFVIKFLMKYIKTHDFKVFGYYRIGLGILVLLVALVKVIAK